MQVGDQTADSYSDSNTGGSRRSAASGCARGAPGQRRLRTALNCENEFEDRGAHQDPDTSKQAF
jgi:hypothetical protein